MRQDKKDNGWGIFRLWINWLIGSGAITVLVILSLWLRPIYLPFAAFGFQFLLFMLIRHNRESCIPSCFILPFVISRVLFWTGIVMILVNFLYSSTLIEHLFEASELNRDIPFICVLITSPITAAISGWGYLRRHKISFCRDCQMRNGTPAERGFLGMIYKQVGSYQVGMLFWLSAVLSIIGWSYYALLYVNTNLSVPDKFVFFWIPTLLWFFSAVYLAARYIGIYGYYRQNVEGSIGRHGTSTLLRYIVIWNDYIAIRPPETDSDKKFTLDEKYDTPVSIYTNRVEDLPLPIVQACFSDNTGVESPEVRFMYANLVGNADCNILHYLCFLTDEQKAGFDRANTTCQWLSLSEIAFMINNRLFNPLLSAEIIRLHTIATAWKTYDSDGRRRYKVKNYRPAFRISEIHGWDVDFNDPHWLYVADNNQDTPFYNLRRFWRKYVNGINH